MNGKRVIEITAQDVYSVRAAIQGGADRVELCTALGVAGLTPSIGVIEGAVEAAAESGRQGFVDVLIRPAKVTLSMIATRCRRQSAIFVVRWLREWMVS